MEIGSLVFYKFFLGVELSSPKVLLWTNCAFPLTLSWRRFVSYRNQSFDLQKKSVDWFLYDRDSVMRELIFKNSRLKLYWINKIFNLFVTKRSILGVWQGSEYVFALVFCCNRSRVQEGTKMQGNTCTKPVFTHFSPVLHFI